MSNISSAYAYLDIYSLSVYNKGMNSEQTNTSTAFERFAHLPSSEQARINREKHLKPFIRGIGAAALALVAITAVNSGAFEGAKSAVQDVVESVTHRPNFSVENISYVVQPGDTLSDIAQLIPGSEGRDWRAIASEIEARNPGLTEALQAGQQINLPSSIE